MRKREKRQYYVMSELIIPFLLLFAFAGFNLYVGMHIGAYAIIFMKDESFFLALAIGIYLYLNLSKYVVKFYCDLAKWRKPVFYIFYYIVYIVLYANAYSYFLYYINNVSNTLIVSEFGAALAFTYKIYPAYILIQILSKIVRFIIITIKNSKLLAKIIRAIKSLEEKARQHDEKIDRKKEEKAKVEENKEQEPEEIAEAPKPQTNTQNNNKNRKKKKRR